METWMHDEIERAFKELFELIAGDLVVHVTAGGTQTNLLTIMDDAWYGEGLILDQAGIRDTNSRDLCFHKAYLTAAGVSLQPTDHYLINGERWDYQEDIAIKNALNPLSGIQEIVVIRVRRSVELDGTTAGSTWEFSP
jgi:hypothetical protein